MARPLHAQLSLPALRANLARVRELAPDTQVLAVVKADAYGHGLMRVLPALEDADGLALVELDAAIRLRAARYARRILLLEGFFTRGRAARDRRAPARRCGAQRSAVADARAHAARAADRSVHQDQHGDESPRHRVDAMSWKPSSGSTIAPSVAVLRLMTHFARADEDYGINEPLATIQRGVPRHAVSALARQFRRCRASRRDRRRDRPPGHHALRSVAVRLRLGGGPSACGR